MKASPGSGIMLDVFGYRNTLTEHSHRILTVPLDFSLSPLVSQWVA